MLEIITDTLLDVLKIIPFLYVTFLIIELCEDYLTDKSKQLITKSRYISPLLGSLLGLLPQCGFSIMATNLYTAKIIPLGALIGIYLSTSDEMLPVLISNKVAPLEIATILLTKFLIGTIVGTIIVLLDKRPLEADFSLCEEENCDCENKGAFVAALKHTLSTTFYLFVIIFILNLTIDFIGSEAIGRLLLKDTIFAPLISALIGLIPNCAASLIITELYLQKIICFPVAISGLLANSGVALIVLFKNNKNKKEIVFIIGFLLLVATISGTILEIFI